MADSSSPKSAAAFIAANTGPSGRGCSCSRPEDCTGDGFCEKFEAAANADTDIADSAAKQPRSSLPWRIEDSGSNRPLNILYRATGLGDGYVAEVYQDEDAEFILRAVNSHDEMLAALKELRQVGNDMAARKAARARADAAISKAEGRAP